jgi:hypothetical protein
MPKKKTKLSDPERQRREEQSFRARGGAHLNMGDGTTTRAVRATKNSFLLKPTKKGKR